MYKLFLCVRYLRTRYLAFICIVSVMLGVATLIVVNAVMSGFSTKLKDRLHGVLSDVVVDTDRLDGFPDATGDMVAKIKASPAGQFVEAVSPTVEVFAIMQFAYRGQAITKPIRLIGIDPDTRTAVGGFSEYLVRQRDAANPSFDLTPEALQHHEWKKRQAANAEAGQVTARPAMPVPDPNAPPPPEMGADLCSAAKLYGAIPGFTLAHFRFKNADGEVVEEAAVRPGDEVTITTAGGADLKPVWGNFLVDGLPQD